MSKADCDRWMKFYNDNLDKWKNVIEVMKFRRAERVQIGEWANVRLIDAFMANLQNTIIEYEEKRLDFILRYLSDSENHNTIGL
jgi:hypothetical protein